MGGYLYNTFDPGDRDPETAEADIREAIREAPEELLGESVREDPNVWTANGFVHWRYAFPTGEECDSFNELDPPTDRILVFEYNDTVDAGWARLYERVDGTFHQTDAYGESNPDCGELTLEYFHNRYGIAGDLR